MTTQVGAVQQLLAQKAQEAAQSEAEEKQALAALNERRRVMFMDAFANLLGDMKDELLPCMYTQGHVEDKAGVWTGAQAQLCSDELEIAPITVSISVRALRLLEALSVSCEVSDGGRGLSWHEVSPEEFADVLFAAHKAYPAWKASVEKLMQQEAETKERNRQQQIANLSFYANWGAHNDEEYVMNRYEMLKALDPTVAEKMLGYWRDAVEKDVKEREQKRVEAEAAEAASVAYVSELAAWQQQCKAWAIEETKKLWVPWTIWEVRYVPSRSVVESEEPDDLIQTIWTLDAPGDFGRVNGFYSVDSVLRTGRVIPDFAFAAFLDATPIHYRQPCITEHLAHHRGYDAGGYWVNVPAFVLDVPDPAPVEPTRPSNYRPDSDLDF